MAIRTEWKKGAVLFLLDQQKLLTAQLMQQLKTLSKSPYVDLHLIVTVPSDDSKDYAQAQRYLQEINYQLHLSQLHLWVLQGNDWEQILRLKQIVKARRIIDGRNLSVREMDGEIEWGLMSMAV